VRLTAEEARRFLVTRHFLAPARSLVGLDGVLAVFRRLGSIQFDPIAVAGRNHDLVLHARMADYVPSELSVTARRSGTFPHAAPGQRATYAFPDGLSALAFALAPGDQPHRDEAGCEEHSQ